MTYSRRRLLISLPLSLLAQQMVQAAQKNSLANPLRVGADVALFESGLAQALRRSFGRDTGVTIQLVAKPSLTLLQALERGELDAVLTSAPEVEAHLIQQGLAHSRVWVARTDWVIVGPAAKKDDTAGIAGSQNALDALRRIREASLLPSSVVSFLSANDGSSAHVAEQALWRDAKLAPAGPWYLSAAAVDASSPSAVTQPSLIQQARQRGAYALVEHGAWSAQGGAPLGVLVQGDPVLSANVHALLGFHHRHPAGKLFVGWIAGPKGRRVVAAHKGYRAPSALPTS
jgi:tungstate transport system substrate-binding protein